MHDEGDGGEDEEDLPVGRQRVWVALGDGPRQDVGGDEEGDDGAADVDGHQRPPDPHSKLGDVPGDAEEADLTVCENGCPAPQLGEGDVDEAAEEAE